MLNRSRHTATFHLHTSDFWFDFLVRTVLIMISLYQSSSSNSTTTTIKNVYTFKQATIATRKDEYQTSTLNIFQEYWAHHSPTESDKQWTVNSSMNQNQLSERHFKTQKQMNKQQKIPIFIRIVLFDRATKKL